MASVIVSVESDTSINVSYHSENPIVVGINIGYDDTIYIWDIKKAEELQDKLADSIRNFYLDNPEKDEYSRYLKSVQDLRD